MEPSTASPYLTAELRAPDAELGLSASNLFGLQIVVTLHAPKPLLEYAFEIFLSPPAALPHGGIDFIR
jgi:hypothetical protein